MDNITIAIENALREYPKARRIAVENFVYSAPSTKAENRANIILDKNLYKWNTDTVNAIKYALKELGKL